MTMVMMIFLSLSLSLSFTLPDDIIEIEKNDATTIELIKTDRILNSGRNRDASILVRVFERLLVTAHFRLQICPPQFPVVFCAAACMPYLSAWVRQCINKLHPDPFSLDTRKAPLENEEGEEEGCFRSLSLSLFFFLNGKM
jgi:hypothetical protein